MGDVNQDHVAVARGMCKFKQLTGCQRNGILQALLQMKNGEKLKHGAINMVAADFGVTRLTVSRIWHAAQKEYREGHVCADVSSKKKEKCGRKRKDYSRELAAIKDVPLNRRGSIRSLSWAVGIPKSTLFDICKRGRILKRVSSTLQPALTDRNKIDRLKFCISKVGSDGRFANLYDYVHIDEKWFYLTQVKRSYYIMMDEEAPHRTCKSKRFITKVMFMAAVARPRYDPHRKQFFDGKIGIWPFVYQEAAKRNSKNRPKGTIITKNIESINAQECKKMVLETVIPAIKNKFPLSHKRKPIYVQQDNAKPHSCDQDEDLVAAGAADGWAIQFRSQPPNSPDLNVLDLGFFNSIQSLQHKAAPNTIDELIACVRDAFDELDRQTLDNVFLTLQSCMEATMLAEGGNSYKLPHLKKATLRRERRLPSTLLCSQQALDTARSRITEAA